jgi:hypothetical protein
MSRRPSPQRLFGTTAGTRVRFSETTESLTTGAAGSDITRIQRFKGPGP